LVSDRLNKVPEKNFWPFSISWAVNSILLQPARVPLTFHLAQGSTSEAIVPAHTQISAPPGQDNAEEVVFETDQELVVTTVRLESIYVRQPDKDLFYKCFDTVTGQTEEAFPIFEGKYPIDHILYIGCKELFSLPQLKKLTLSAQTDSKSSAQTLSSIPLSQSSSTQSPSTPTLKWSYWDGTQWQILQIPPSSEFNQNPWNVSFSNIPPMMSCVVDGQDECWIQARLQPILTTSSSIQSIECQAEIEFISIPVQCFYNTISLDLNKEFYPFGEDPRLNDTFYIALSEEFFNTGGEFQPESTIKIRAILAADKFDSSDLEIAWEFGDGTEWKRIGDVVQWKDNQKAIDFTSSNSAEATFLLPKQLLPSMANGQSGHWLRARITKGSYNQSSSSRIFTYYEDAALLEEEAAQASQSITVYDAGSLRENDIIRIQSEESNKQNIKEECTVQKIENTKLTLTKSLKNNYAIGHKVLRKVTISETITQKPNPPLLKSLELTYTLTIKKRAVYCTYNDFAYLSSSSRSLNPFTPTLDLKPTLYLGFSQPELLDQQNIPPFSNKPVTLYAEVEPPPPDAVSNPADRSKPPQVVWEYSSPTGWSYLPGVQDQTQAFFQRGLIQFIGPPDLRKQSQFGQELYWLRVRWVDGNFQVKPRLRRLLTNTTWGVQAMTLRQEVLGSSNGDSHQTFFTSQIPVLEGQELEVQEDRLLTDGIGTIEATWVQWQEVPDFYSSKAMDRHYVLDRQTGKVQFGDGQSGMIPPRGTNNIRMAAYRTGGGTRGNKPAQTITELKTTIPYVDRVINLEAAGGGAEQEDLEHLKERVPKQLRHRDRAVTEQDFEDLSYAASTEVARVKVIAPDATTKSFDPLLSTNWLDPKTGNPIQVPGESRQDTPGNVGQVKVIIVPNSRERQPTPSLALLKQVETYLRDRCEPGLICS
jgi:hypothetical protein